MRCQNEDHLRRDWRVRALAPDFDLLDVWRFPVEIEPEVPFASFVDFLRHALQQSGDGKGAAARLFQLRAWLGERFGWDDEAVRHPIPGCEETSVCERIPAQDRQEFAPLEMAGPAVEAFEPVYEDPDEILLELSNATVHALLHLGRDPLESTQGTDGRWAPLMAVYAKPRGFLGRAYMAAIGPFRHGIVYPSLMRRVRSAWPRYLAQHPSASGSD
ncbi:MAG: DUF2867 domain-containing protein [Myxococcota bacterium]